MSTAVGQQTSSNASGCLGTARTFKLAVQQFDNNCPGAKYRDCDRSAGIWTCSSEVIGTGGLRLNPNRNVAVPVPTEPMSEPTQQTAACSTSHRNLGTARTLFAQSCPTASGRDCDRSGGIWTCSAERIGSGGFISLNPASQTPSEPSSPTSVPSPPTTAVNGVVRIEAESSNPSDSGWVREGEILVYRSPNSFTSVPNSTPLVYKFTVPVSGTYQLRLRARAVQQTAGRSDLHNDAWIRMDGGPVAGLIDVRQFRKVFTSGNGSFQIAGTAQIGEERTAFRQNLTAGQTHTLTVVGRSQGYGIDYFEIVPFDVTGSQQGVPNLPPLLNFTSSVYRDTFNEPYVEGDLVVMNFDSSFDPDDNQAWIVNREILDDMPNVDYIAINGTKRRDFDGVIPGSTSRLRELFPTALDAFANVGPSCTRSGTTTFCEEVIQQTATIIALTLATGNRVHVAEGGPSSFTADVVRELIRRGITNEALQRIRVIQHSNGTTSFNEGNTPASDLDVVRRYTEYVRIGNGNLDAGNHSLTPDLNQDRTAAANAFRIRALNSEYADQWRDAFGIINNKADASDSVELIWILGIETNLVPDLEAIADRYFE